MAEVYEIMIRAFHWLLLAALQVAFCWPSLAEQSRPNVLFVAIDDLNDWVNCLDGREGVHTPNLDRLASQGVLFTNAHCAAPACNPSRVAVMTGVRPSSSGVYNNGQDWRRSPRLAQAVTIPEHFRQHGYETLGCGKIFHALSWIKNGYGKSQNDPKCWNAYFPSVEQPMPKAHWPTAATAKTQADGYVTWTPIAAGEDRTGRPPHFFDWGSLGQSDDVMADYKVVDWAIAELQKERKKPLFLAVGIFRPHIPWYAPDEYFDLYPLNEVELPKVRRDDLDDCPQPAVRQVRRSWQQWMIKNDLWRSAVQSYLASISFADAQVGRLLDALQRSPYAENTIVVLWSDHGMHIGEKEQWEKFTLWEESTRVPLIVVAPGITSPNTRSEQPVSLIDVYPTLVELCRLPKRDDLEGLSLAAQIKDPQAKRAQPAITTWGRNNHAIRTERWRYIRYANGDEELYDHAEDPDEFFNHVSREQDESQIVISKLKRWLPTVNAASVSTSTKK